MNHLIKCIILLCAVQIFGQNCNYTLSGSVVDFHDGTNLKDAVVKINNLDLSSKTNENGIFSFENVCAGTYTITFSHHECTPKTMNVALNSSKNITIRLEHHVEELEEVTINNEGNRAHTNTAQETVLDVGKIEEYSSGSLGDAIETISGVSAIKTGNNIVKPIINGLHSSRVLIVNNEVRLQDQDWGIEHAPNIDINGVERISVIKGSSALAYGGDALGGVVVLDPLKIYKKDSLYGKTIASYNTNNRGYTLSSALTKSTNKGWYINGQGTYKRFGDGKAPDYILTNTGLDSKAFSVQTGYRTFERSLNLYYSYIDNEIGILASSHIGNIDNLIEAINNGTPLRVDDFSYDINNPRQRIRHQLAKAEYTQRFASLGKWTIQYDYQRNHREEFDRRRGDRDDLPAIDLILQTHGLKSNFLFDKNSNRKYNVGVLYQYQDNFADPATGVRRLIPDYERYDAGVFATAEWKLNNGILVESGLRYDFTHLDAQKFYQTTRWNEEGYNIDFADWVVEDLGTQLLTNPVYDFHNVSFSVGAKKRINNHQVLFNYGLSNRAPNPAELFSDGLRQSLARIEIGNLRLDKETAHRISGTYQYKNKKINLTVEPYFSKINNFIFIVPTEQGIALTGNSGAFLEYEYKSTDALIYGIDFSLDYHLTKQLFIQNRTAFLIGEDLDNDEPLVDMPPFNAVTSVQYENKKWWNFKTSLTSELVLMQNNYPNFNFIYTDPLDGVETYVDVSTPSDAYHLFHFKSSISTKIFKKSELQIGFNIQNIFNTSYRDYLSRLRFFADEPGRNFQLQIKINY